ncbi:uncharacterized protein LOC106642635 [Copidosoma floridanum]|uniref:uncharacterized protein LOC106642635 n=1 Tax=Copidosoma floridanum TaxID=29053 RepID=UPI0006C99991|nr:uncharacterized protein LOC106642635 [Copidosoma floridanum]
MDIVDPLRTCKGYSHVPTIIDCFSRWVQAIPLQDIQAFRVLHAFQATWVSRFCTPRFITTDQGSKLESAIFKAYLFFIDCQKKRTVAYHLAANGLIERWHRSFKAALMCHNSANWVKLLPTVLLRLYTAV